MLKHAHFYKNLNIQNIRELYYNYTMHNCWKATKPYETSKKKCLILVIICDDLLRSFFDKDDNPQEISTNELCCILDINYSIYHVTEECRRSMTENFTEGSVSWIQLVKIKYHVSFDWRKARIF